MDITVYLPDAIRKRAKEADLNLSRMLRDAVEQELDRQATLAETLSEPGTHELELEDDEGRLYKGRFVGTTIAESRSATVYVTQDERVLVYDGEKLQVHDVGHDAEEALRNWLREDSYVEAMHALGFRPVVDL